AAARRDTALFIAADPGQVVSPPDQHVQLEDHPALRQMLLMRPTGEPRVAYLYARQGYQRDVVDYINERLGQAMIAISAEEALDAGLFGPSPHAPATRERLGDVVVIMRQDYILLTAAEKEKADKMIGRHGGMVAAEMQVPWLGFRLDAHS
ncbi:MAG TPA: alkaline phosphatase family protein, partial [Anaerolineae bacterium]